MPRVRAIILAATVLLAPAAAPARAETVVRWATPEPLLTWDPHGAEVSQTLVGQRQVYEGLTNVDPNLVLRSSLAVSWALVAPDRWRFELRPGVRFHDGTPLAAEDVVFSLDRARAPTSPVKANLGSVAEVLAAGPSAVEVRTRGPDLLLPVRLRTTGIMSARWAREHGVAAATPYHEDAGTYARDHAVGTGPFRLEAAEAGGPAVLVKNPDWWGLKERPNPIDRILWAAIPDGRERAAARRKGEVDLAQDLPPDEAGRLRAAPGVRLKEVAELRVAYLGFNQGLDELPGSDVRGRNPFRDRRVREAVYRAIDIGRVIAEGTAGFAEPAGMIVAPGINGWSEELDRRLPHDPERARRLLAEAGYPDGFTVPLLCRPVLEAACRVVAAQLAGVGIRAAPEVPSPSEFLRRTDTEAADAAGFWLGSVGNTSFDSQYTFRNFYHTGGWLEGRGYANPDLDAQIDAVDTELSSAVRDALIERVWQRVLPDVVAVPLVRRKLLIGSRDWLEVPLGRTLAPFFAEARLTSPPVR
jgi:peptide/nickel transport system substrate-binding protein